MKDKYIVALVNRKTGNSGLRKIVEINNADRDMAFIDTKGDMVWVDEILTIGEIKYIEHSISDVK